MESLTCTWAQTPSSRNNPTLMSDQFESDLWRKPATPPAGTGSDGSPDVLKHTCMIPDILRTHLYESSCWVPSLLKVFLSVLLLNLQSKPRTEDPLTHTHTLTGK